VTLQAVTKGLCLLFSTCCGAPSGDGKTMTHAQLVDALMGMTPAAADKEAATIMTRLHFASTYAFAKLLTEQLVDDPDTLPGVAKAIVRPSLVLSYAAGPYPG
jgi:hypothetical protein